KAEQSSCRKSIWSLDRIVYYLFQELKEPKPSARTLADCIEFELDRLKAVNEKASSLPLHHAIRALLPPKLLLDEPNLEALLTEVEQYLKDSKNPCRYKGILQNIEKFRHARPTVRDPAGEVIAGEPHDSVSSREWPGGRRR